MDFGTASQVSGQQAYDLIYQQIDSTGTGVVQGSVFASHLARTQLPNNVLSQIWGLANTQGTGVFSKDDVYLALKLAALAQNGKEVRVENVSLPNIPPPQLKPLPGQELPGGSIDQMVGAGGAEGWAVSAEEKAQHDRHFASLQPVNGFVSGKLARDFLLRSGLPVAVLGQIWGLADVNRDGRLDSEEFAVAMHLVQMALNQQAVPTTLPEELVPPSQRGTRPTTPTGGAFRPMSPLGSMASGLGSGGSGVAWVVNPQAKAGYDNYFRQCDHDKDGLVSGNDVMGLFSQSGLPQATLAQIWALADPERSGQLDSESFALAMYLISKTRAGAPVPPVLPRDHIPPSRRKATSTVSSPTLARVGGARTVSAPLGSMTSMGSANFAASPPVGPVPTPPLPPSVAMRSVPLSGGDAAQIAALDVRLRQAEETRASTEADAVQRGAAVLALNDQISQKRAEIDQLEQAIAEKEVLVSEAQRKHAVAEKQLAQLTARLDELRAQEATVDEQLAGLHAASAELEQRQATAQQEYADAYAQVQEREEEVGTLQAHIGDREQELGAYTAATAQLNQRLSELDAQVEEQTGRFGDIEEAIDAGTAESAALEAAVQERHAQLDGILASVAQRTAELDTITQAIAARKAELATVDGEIEAKNAHAKQLEEQARALDEEHAGLQRQLETRRALAASAAAAALAAATQLATAQTRHAETNAQLAQVPAVDEVAAAPIETPAAEVSHVTSPPGQQETTPAPAPEPELPKKEDDVAAVEEKPAATAEESKPEEPVFGAVEDDFFSSAAAVPVPGDSADPFAAAGFTASSLGAATSANVDPFASNDFFNTPAPAAVEGDLFASAPSAPANAEDDDVFGAQDHLDDLYHDPFGTSDVHDPFGTHDGELEGAFAGADDPFGSFASPVHGDDPFGAPVAPTPGADPFGTSADLFASTSAHADDPFGTAFSAAPSTATADDPFGLPPVAAEGDDLFGAPRLAADDLFGAPRLAADDLFGAPRLAAAESTPNDDPFGAPSLATAPSAPNDDPFGAPAAASAGADMLFQDSWIAEEAPSTSSAAPATSSAAPATSSAAPATAAMAAGAGSKPISDNSLANMSEEEQMRRAMEESMRDMTPEEREAEEMRLALEASMRDI